ncbi:hypothetical protein JCM17380_13160 [Desulfosporosinus burensis]
MYYIFIISDIELKERILQSREILDYLLGNGLWAFNSRAPYLKKLKQDDKVLVYVAGKKNSAFIACFTLASQPLKVTHNQSEPIWLFQYPYRVSIVDIEQFMLGLPIANIIDKLDFIQNKKYYGIYFRKSIKAISEKDYTEILRSMHQIND